MRSLEYQHGWNDAIAWMKSRDDVRSYPQLKRFFALVKAAFEHWPEGNPFQPECAEHLRAYLIVRAGFKTARTIRLHGPMSLPQRDHLELILETAMRAGGSWAIIDVMSSYILVQKPASVSYEETPHTVACKIFSAVDELIPIEMPGMTADRLLREAEKAA